MFNFILAQQAPSGGFGDMSTIILFGGMIIIFYFFMIRPQQKKQKAQKSFVENIKKGDPIVTIGGMHGKVVALDDATVTIEVDKGAKIKFEKSSISLEATERVNKKEKPKEKE